MTGVLTYPLATPVVVGWLTTQFAGSGVVVATKVPNPRPAELVKPRRVGGPARNLVLDAPMFLFECWSTTGPAAEQLCELTRGYVLAFNGETFGGVWCSHVDEIGGPVDFPDPDSAQPRWTYSAQLLLRQL